MISLSKNVVRLGWSSVNPMSASVQMFLPANNSRWHTFDFQITTHERLAHIDMFYLYFHFVLLTVGRLTALEAASGAEKGRGRVGEELYSMSAYLE